MHNMLLIIKKLDQRATEMLLWEFEKEENLLYVISESYKNGLLKTLSELFGMSGQWGVQKGAYRIHLTDLSNPSKFLPIDHAFFFHFYFPLFFIYIFNFL